MIPRLTTALVFTVCILASAASIALGKDLPTLTITRTAAAPTIDGKIIPEEWAMAAGVSNFQLLSGEKPAKDQTEVMLMFDDENLYLAFRCSHPYDKIRAEVEKRDGQVWKDDAVELFIQPDPSSLKCFQFIGNRRGAIYDGIGMDATWNGPWNYKAFLSQEYWGGEVSISFSSLGMVTPAEGMTIGFNACRNQQTPTRVLSTWSPLPPTEGFHNPGYFGRLVFSNSSPVIRVFSTDINASGRVVGIKAKAINSTNSVRRLTGYFLISQNGKEVSKKEFDLRLAPNSFQPIQHCYDCGFGDFSAEFVLQETSDSGKRTLLITDSYFFKRKHPSHLVRALLYNVPGPEPGSLIDTAQKEFGTSEAQWYPYYENKEHVKSSHPDVKASFYHRKDKGLLLVVGNLSKNKVAASVEINLKRFELSGILKVKNVLENKELSTDGQQIRLFFDPWQTHIISITR